MVSRAPGECFHSSFVNLTNFRECFYNSIETGKMLSLIKLLSEALELLHKKSRWGVTISLPVSLNLIVAADSLRFLSFFPPIQLMKPCGPIGQRPGAPAKDPPCH